MRARFRRDRHAAEHARQFVAASVDIQCLDLRARGRAVAVLAHAQVCVSLRRDLRQMGHAQHLTHTAERAQFLSDDLRDRAADAAVDLVEHHAADIVQTQHADLEGQADARQFTAGGDASQRARRLSGIGADQEFAALAALRIDRIGRARFQRHLQLSAGHAERAHQCADLGAEALRGLLACRAEGGSCGVVIARQRIALARQYMQARAGTLQALVLGAQLRQQHG